MARQASCASRSTRKFQTRWARLMPCLMSSGRSASCEVSVPICWKALGTSAIGASRACSANSSTRRSACPSFTLRNHSASCGTRSRGNSRLCPQHPSFIQTTPVRKEKILCVPAAKNNAISKAQLATQIISHVHGENMRRSTGSMDLRNVATSTAIVVTPRDPMTYAGALRDCQPKNSSA